MCGKSKLIVCLFDIVLVSSYYRLCYSNKTYVSKNLEPPEIWLSSFQQTGSSEDNVADKQFQNSYEFKNEFISKLNVHDYIIQHDTRQVVFICQAKYPVMWNVPHLKQVENFPFEMFKTDTVRVADFGQVPENKYFRTSLTVNFDGNIRNVFSVNFTCKLPKANETSGHQFSEARPSSIHLFYFEGLQAIENSGKVMEIKVPKRYSNDTIIIPCRPSLPTALVHTEKKIKNQHINITMDKGIEGWKNLTKITYNPKYGFTVNKNVTESLSGQYRCTLMGKVDSTKKDQVVLFSIYFEDNKPTLEDIEFQPLLNLSGNAVLMYEKNKFGKNIPSRNLSTLSSGKPKLWCCTGVDKAKPKIYKRKCTGQLQCEILKRSMTFNVMQRNDDGFEYNYAVNGQSSKDQDDCVSTKLYRGNVIVFCKGENILFGDYLTNLFNDKLIPASTTLNGAPEPNLWSFEPESSKAAANVSRRIFITLGHPVKKYQEYEQSMKFVTFIRSNEYAPNSNQYIAEYSRDHFYVGEQLIPICLGWLSFYSQGAFVRVLFANGTSTILNMKDEEKPLKYLLNFSGGYNGGKDYLSGDLVEFTFGKQILAQKDMASFECWMPQWNSEKWDKREFQVKVLDPIKPSFLEGLDGKVTTVHFDAGKENETLEWRILGGLPNPVVNVTLDGMRLLSQDFQDIDQGYESNHVFDKYNLTVARESRSDAANNTGDIVKVKIVFAKITDNVHGAYECKVNNVGGTVAHIFEVKVRGINANNTKQS